MVQITTENGQNKKAEEEEEEKRVEKKERKGKEGLTRQRLKEGGRGEKEKHARLGRIIIAPIVMPLLVLASALMVNSEYV